jgi:hypothetical protein
VATPLVVTSATAPVPAVLPPATQPLVLDRSTPDKTLASLCRAMQAADRAGIYACLTADPARPTNQLDASLDEALATRRMILTAEKAYGLAEAANLIRGELTLDVALQPLIVLRQMQGATASIDGDSATIIMEVPAVLMRSVPPGIQSVLNGWSGKPIYFVLRDGAWRIDMDRSIRHVMTVRPIRAGRGGKEVEAEAALAVAVLKQFAANRDAIAARIANGELKTAADARRAERAKYIQMCAKFGIYDFSTYDAPP